MRWVKELIRSIEDRNLDMQERLFRLLVSLGLCGLAAGIVYSVLLGEDIISIGVLSVAFLFFVSMFFFALRFGKTQTVATIVGFVLIFVMLPFTFMSSGGIYSGMPIWFLFGFVFVSLVVEGRARYLLLIGGFFADALCYYIAYTYPSLVIQHTLETTYIDSLISLAVIGVLTCSMIWFQNAIYRSENEIARKQTEEIEELNRAQSRFFSSMSHEIRTPINTIIGLNELILREAKSDEVAEDASKIQDASKMLLTLINDFLDMSKIQSGKMEIMPAAYDEGSLLSDVVNMTWVRAQEKGLEFQVDVDQNVPLRLVGDEMRIKQILINVLNNAVKYTPSGSVSLSVQSEPAGEGRVQMIYTIKDTGIGIKKESIPSLFNAFKRVDEEESRHIEGTGLGLAIVRQLLDLMGGDIAVNSVYTKGSTFVITLPQKSVGRETLGDFTPGLGHGRGERQRYEQSFEAPKARVLIVDDNEANLMVAQKLLKQTKVQIDTATSGKACLEKTLQTRYDVILMDHLMPEMDGVECFHAVRTQTGGLNQGVPIVALTANAGEEYRSFYMKEGFEGYLLKPISGKQLEEEILRRLPSTLVSVTRNEPVGIVEGPVLTHQRRMSVLVSTDSVCDLPAQLIAKYRISVMPYRVCTEDGEFLDGIEAETDGILSYISEKGKQVRSEAPSVADYEEYFAEQLTKAQTIIHISMAQKVSDGYANALEASRAFDNVSVIDSGHLSSGLGLMVLWAARLAQSGMNAEDIAGEIGGLKGRIRTSFIMDSTEYLSRVGRISGQVNALCRALMLHPVIMLKNSGMTIGRIIFGAQEQVRRKYIDSMLSNKKDIDTNIVFITYAGMTRAEIEQIEAQVRSRIAFQRVVVQKASPAISTNCGPGSFGLLLVMK